MFVGSADDNAIEPNKTVAAVKRISGAMMRNWCRAFDYEVREGQALGDDREGSVEEEMCQSVWMMVGGGERVPFYREEGEREPFRRRKDGFSVPSLLLHGSLKYAFLYWKGFFPRETLRELDGYFELRGGSHIPFQLKYPMQCCEKERKLLLTCYRRCQSKGHQVLVSRWTLSCESPIALMLQHGFTV